MPATVDTGLLRTFVAIADFGSFARAAASANLAQPTISLQMKRLEEQTGARLFRRDGRSSAMTALVAELSNRSRATARQ